jgi:iron complex outermembrane receptor protein
VAARRAASARLRTRAHAAGETLVIEGHALDGEREQSNERALEALRRTPSGVALVSQEEIERTRAASLEDVLEGVPGVYVRARGTGEEPQISIRGSGLRSNFHTRGVNVWIDGFPFQNADGFSDVESFEFLAARRVEVWKGASSARFGGTALGGALNLVTETGRSAPRVRLRSEAGSFGFWKSYAQGAFASGPWDTFLALSDTRQDGYREHANQKRQRAYTSRPRRLRRRGMEVAMRRDSRKPGLLAAALALALAAAAAG